MSRRVPRSPLLPCASGPDIEIWRGHDETFGTVGIPQRWVNILGNVADPDGVASLTYRLNGGPWQPLNMGPTDDRLAYPGDFNVELDNAALLPGANTVELTAVDALGNASTTTVNVDWEGAGRAWPMPYTAHWTSAASASQQAQIIEGQWVYDGNGIRPAATGFDRLVTLGSMSWTDYDVTATITFNSFDLSKPALGSAAGLALGWQGHSDWGQPHFGHPSGGLCFYDSDGQDPGLFKLLLAYSPGPAHDTVLGKSFMDIPLGVPYKLRFREQRIIAGSTRYSCKSGRPPAPTDAWTLQTDITDWGGVVGTRPGSVVLVAHNSDATFGDVSIRPSTG